MNRITHLSGRLTRCVRTAVCRLALLAGILSQGSNLRAQEALGPFVSTIGTSVREAGSGRDWAYLLWTANSPALLHGRSHAVYAKTGDASAATAFTRIAIVSLQTESVTLTPLLARAAAIGDDTNVLGADIDALFGKFVSSGLPLTEKLSAVVRGGLIDQKHYGRLLLLARTHPSVAMALGFGHATLIEPGVTTFEIREFDQGTATEGAVIGRVTVTAGAPVVLPAPGSPVAMPNTDARGHLNAQLRWGVPDSLRRLSLLQHGYNVWRVREDFAESRGWHLNPPAPNALNTSVGQTTAVRRVNRLPLLTSRTFTPAEAANVLPPNGDTNTIFVVDDNDRGRPNSVTTLDFTNGARFYYFVTARDVLGRDGAVSRGTQVQICDQLPPNALSNVDVLNDFTWQVTSNRHQLRVVWPQASNLPSDEERIRAYWVYRWTNVTELRLNQGNPTNNLIAVVPHIPGVATNSYRDSSPGAPSPKDRGETFWYTVRAEDSGACRGNLSPHSAPAFGIIRDRTGPAAPSGTVTTACLVPTADFLIRTTNGNPNASVGDASFQFTIGGVRGHQRVEWMELSAEVRPVGSSTVSARYTSDRLFFGPGTAGSFLAYPFDVPESLAGQNLFITAVAGFGDGTSGSGSAFQVLALDLIRGDRRVVFTFAARVEALAKNRPCNEHFPVGPDGTLVPVEIDVQPTPGSRELRVYRRIDDGPLELICSRELTNLSSLQCLDDTFPHGGGRVCYFATTLDEHGNGSPMTRLGCRYSFESSPPPRPQLSPITPLEPEEAPQMLLSWFCPSVNVDRFEVSIGAIGQEIRKDCAPGFLDLIPPPALPEFHSVNPEVAASSGLDSLALKFRRFLTPQPGGAFGSGDRFVIPVDVEAGRHYIVKVKSVMRSGARSEESNQEWFIWRAPQTVQPLVPWPARPLPPLGNSFRFSFDASWMLPCGETNGPSNIVVRISPLGNAVSLIECPPTLDSAGDPNALVPTNSDGESLFPVMLFRRQVPNDDFPSVSGDSVQVTPLMESIAWGLNGGRSVLYDPYVLVERGARALGGGGLYLRDTQPIIRGARYRYSLVRFNKLGEMAEVIGVANEVEVP
ncbi:MAG: hypothetical protein JNN07_23145 [Verrucomicrobiales bacterium]|nr:hypothetical protein [Verrucomicrobiales bacterium]